MIGKTDIAIITARGGSKRIPRKNVKPFMGKPMISYAIGACLNSGVFERVMVSTDDAEIAETARAFGAEVPFMRSEETSNDFATTADVISEVIEAYAARGEAFSSICCVYPCVPLLRPETLRAAAAEFAGCGALSPVCRFHTPIEHALRIRGGFIEPVNRAMMNTRTQDLEPCYYDVGMFYFIETGVFKAHKTMFPPQSKAFVIADEECQDIDTHDDWRLAELKYSLIFGNEKDRP